MRVDYDETVKFLRENDNYIILSHQDPDGDTTGAGFGLCYMLRKMGKKANILCSDEFPARYGFLYGGYSSQKFPPKTIITVDIADKALIGQKYAVHSEYVDLCIDHHKSNTEYAKRLLLDSGASASCEILYELFLKLDTEMDLKTAECIYTGIAADTGCFKYSNTTKRSHIIASELLEMSVRYDKINRLLFDVKTKERLAVESYVSSHIEYFMDDRCAIIILTQDIIKEMGFDENDLKGVTNLCMQLESVEVGVMMRERSDGKFKVSMRSSTDKADVSDICAKLNGGGHSRAAGCMISEKLEKAKLIVLSVIAPALGIDLWLA